MNSDENCLTDAMVCDSKKLILTDCLDANIETLTQRAIALYSEKKNNSQRLIISVSGVPGSGKSTVTDKVRKNLNKILGLQIAIVLPQDGFHYYRSELLDMEDPQMLIDRRGAPFTFNSSRLIELVKKVKYQYENTLFAPSFSHELKDPEENSIQIGPLVRIILLEGNYIHLNDDRWSELHELSDEKWLVFSDINIIKERLIQRHVRAGICNSVEESVNRVENNDLLNAKYIIENSVKTDVIFMNQ